MVKIMENPEKMDDLGGNPLFSETSIYIYVYIYFFFWVYFQLGESLDSTD